tara:strand:+ start:4550 stop:5851 length:1302 start_codon:yes stop_codon:yes gene_type:complete
MKVVAFVPAKGSSSRVESKNVKLLDGKPLFMHTIEKLMLCEFIDEVYLDTESEALVSIAEESGCKILFRDPQYANNSTDGNRLFLNEVNQVEADVYLQVLCTSPFISIDTLKAGVDVLTDPALDYDSALLVKNEKLYTWSDSRPNYSIEKIPNSIDLPSTIIETMGLYIVKRAAALKTQRRIGDNPKLLEASPLEAIDVNWPADFELANLIAAGMREKNRKLLENIKSHLTSSMLSDILDDIGFPAQIIKNLSPNFMDAKIFGRAKTLKLRELRDGEDFKGIYNALHSYDTVIPNDIILVENEVGEFAYFGELNANLAIRSGAAGVVISGNTRDSREVRQLGLPVFSKGFTCQDVRKRATMDSMNKKICIEGVYVSPEDLVFGDAEGVVVLPKRAEKKIMAEIFLRISNEKQILVDISNGKDVDHLVKEYGFF